MKNQTRNNPGISTTKRLSRIGSLLIVLLSLIPANGMAAPALAASPQNSDSLTSLSLEGIRRALIIAPHPDDETLAAGGLIESVLSRGGQVKVVLVTNAGGPPVGAFETLDWPAWQAAVELTLRSAVELRRQNPAEAKARAQAARQLALPPAQQAHQHTLRCYPLHLPDQ